MARDPFSSKPFYQSNKAIDDAIEENQESDEDQCDRNCKFNRTELFIVCRVGLLAILPGDFVEIVGVPVMAVLSVHAIAETVNIKINEGNVERAFLIVFLKRQELRGIGGNACDALLKAALGTVNAGNIFARYNILFRASVEKFRRP